MNTKIVRATEISRPTPTPLTSSVLEHATVAGISSFGLRNNGGLWPSYNCLDTTVPTPMCPDPVTQMTFGTAPWVPAFEFAVHGGVHCKAVGLDREDQLAELKRVFALNEGKGVEQGLLFNRFVSAGSDDEALWGDPVDLGASTVVGALAALEGYAAAVYAGQPTIHMPRAAASLLGERIKWDGTKAFTPNGAKVAIGGGYDSDDPSDALGPYEMFATGEVYVERSEEISLSSITIPGVLPDESGDVPEYLQDNNVLAIAQRMYRVGVDCFVAKATGSTSTSSGGGFGN